MGSTQSLGHVEKNVQSRDEFAKHPIKRILAAIDGSKMADNALYFAAQIAQHYSAELDLIHVNVMPSDLVDKPATGAAFHPITPESKTRPLEEKELARNVVLADEALLLERKKILEARQLRSQEISVSSDTDNIADEITRICKEGEYDLVAVGSRGRGAVRSFLLGSVSKRVVREVGCSVLVSKIDTDSIRRILLAYDGSPSSRKALAFTADLASKFGANVNVITVMSSAAISPELVVSSAVEHLEEDMRYYADEAVSKLKELGASAEEPTVVGATDIANAIAKEAEGGFYDLVVLGNRGWGRVKSLLLGSIASGVVESVRTNVAIVK